MAFQYSDPYSEPGIKRNFIKFLIAAGAIGIVFGIFIFVMNNSSILQTNPLASGIIIVSLAVILIGFYLINKMRMDFV